MVYKSFSVGGDTRAPSTPRELRLSRPYQEGSLIGLVGNINRRRVSRTGREEHLEQIVQIDDELLGYNIAGDRILVRCAQNDRQFDCYLALPFTKGVTERETGRTLLILGSNAHHGEAMQGQFPGLVWSSEEPLKKYGDTIRWINVGDTLQGFIGLDYNPQAKKEEGVACQLSEVKFLAETLLKYGIDSQKRLYLLKPPYIQEREEGRRLRQEGLVTLKDYSQKKIPSIGGGQK